MINIIDILFHTHQTRRRSPTTAQVQGRRCDSAYASALVSQACGACFSRAADVPICFLTIPETSGHHLIFSMMWLALLRRLSPSLPKSLSLLSFEYVPGPCIYRSHLYLSMMRLALLRGSSPSLPDPPPPSLLEESLTHRNAAPPMRPRNRKVEKICTSRSVASGY